MDIAHTKNTSINRLKNTRTKIYIDITQQHNTTVVNGANGMDGAIRTVAPVVLFETKTLQIY